MDKFPKIARHLAVVAMLLANAAAVPQQAGNRYTVEIVVFRTASQSGALTGAESRAPAGADDVEPSMVATRRLATAASRLRGAGGYRVLAHTAWTQDATTFRSRNGVSAARLGIGGTGITGKVMVLRGTVLSLGIDLTIDEGGRRYRISEVRPVKSGETQYFDHPAVGVIAVVTAGG